MEYLAHEGEVSISVPRLPGNVIDGQLAQKLHAQPGISTHAYPALLDSINTATSFGNYTTLGNTVAVTVAGAVVNTTATDVACAGAGTATTMPATLANTLAATTTPNAGAGGVISTIAVSHAVSNTGFRAVPDCVSSTSVPIATAVPPCWQHSYCYSSRLNMGGAPLDFQSSRLLSVGVELQV